MTHSPSFSYLKKNSTRKYYFYHRPIGDPSETHRRLTCLIEELSETNMPDQKTIGDLGISVSDGACRYPMGHVGPRWVSVQACRSLIGHVGLQWVSVQTCRSPMGHVSLRWSMSMSPMSLWSGISVYDRSLIIIIFLWTRIIRVKEKKCSSKNCRPF